MPVMLLMLVVTTKNMAVQVGTSIHVTHLPCFVSATSALVEVDLL